MSVIMCKYGCLSDTDEHPDFSYDERTHEYTCANCAENEVDEWRMRQYEREQQDMFDSPDWNWSGLR
tara:strand:+ start:2701 stop:2901 length:201 start_codon:yes stop_codon:yes gene_type:complete